MLLLQRGHHRHHRFDKARPVRALRPKAPLAPEDPRPNRALGGVVRGLHPFVPHECPQGLPQLAQLPAGALGLGHPTRLTRFQQPLHCLPHGPHVAGKSRVGQGPLPDPMPPLEHLPGLRAQGLANLPGTAPAFDHGFDVPQQMCPAHLPSPGRVPGVGAPAIGHQPPPELLPQQLLGHFAPARQANHKHGDVRGDRGPQPRALRPFPPAGLIR